ncbi:Intraflagellar transport protein 46 [Phytophthora citrophthora]|uniref:Intraflagellar transport protein 46 n=1 Tax=Phytophthora citrophthora TaxID=4793 RepID=A0AAD9GG65_9STRA|nr:Intraflagellar transport protein 46 [Phytophthora citrophthora]
MSVDTAASSPTKQLHDDSSSEGDDEDVSSDSSSEEEFSGRDGGEFESISRAQSSGEDSDEPPEIPGSPIAQKFQAEGVTAADFGAIPIKSRFPPDRSNTKSTGVVDDEEYQVKEVEQSRAVEFHASSSSEDESDDSEQKSCMLQIQERSALGRPKTAATDLEKYRDVVPNDFFQQLEGVSSQDTSLSSTVSTKIIKKTNGANASIEIRQRKYKVDVPRELEELFSLTDAYTPEEIEIETRLEPFLPEFTPSVGVPFDGILIPRPDGKEDTFGVVDLREPSGKTNVAELELLMQVSMTNKNKIRSRSEIVRSIDNASHRPQEIDRWITSVAKVQKAKSLTQVNYKQSMPPLAQLMELWPEEFEDFLTAKSGEIPPLSKLDVNLKELVKIVCNMVDIPVYEGNYVQSLHVLFSLYLEIQAYEREQGSQR